MNHPRIVLAIAGISVAALAGGATLAATAGGSATAPTASATASPATPSTATATTPGGTTAVPASTATIHTVTAMVGGASETVLVNSTGLPLYFYKSDTATSSKVSGELAALWPPLDASAPIAHGAAGVLGVVHTSNGNQVTYNGHFLYTFADDTPGQVSGQGVQNFFVATPGLMSIRTVSSAPTTMPAPVARGY
jgi:predicted lipoprotein with Yx(FWY)xxD motif